MTQEEKQLLFKDLCGRLPYGVILDNPNPYGEHWDELISIDIPNGTVTLLYDGRTYKVEETKPYLRPMSSMTDEEIEFMDDKGFRVYKKTNNFDNVWDVSDDGWDENYVDKQSFEDVIDFFCSHHLDYRGLIEKGLALEATEDIYKTK